MKRKIINLIITLVAGLVYFYLFLPALNLSSMGFYIFASFLLLVYGLLSVDYKVDVITRSKHSLKVPFNTIMIIPCIFALIFILNFFVSPLFDSKAYANRIAIDDSVDFQTGVREVDFKKVPLLDKDSSEKLGDRTMGEMSDLVSQYYVSDLYTQINYKDDIVRVTPLEYADIIKYISNRKEGIKGYITVNSVNGEAKVTRLEKGMKYVPSAILNEDMIRHLRFAYPTTIFGSYTFEIDDEGNPYFIIPKVKYTCVGLRKDISGVIVLDPVSGETTDYDVGNVPTWIDNVFEADLIIEQTDDWGTYQSGFWNSLFAQKNVVNTTDGYNYLVMDGDVFLYTGITSIQSDESNLGFILANMRTKETKFYSAPSAEEYSAMASAEGQVQEMSYNSTFPLLINLQGRPTYLVSLKDAAGLVKKYAFIDVQDYQKVSVTDVTLGIDKAAKNYLSSLGTSTSGETTETKIRITGISTAIIEGNTHYYFVDEEKNKYSVTVTVAPNTLPFLRTNDEIEVSYIDGDVRVITDIK